MKTTADAGEGELGTKNEARIQFILSKEVNQKQITIDHLSHQGGSYFSFIYFFVEELYSIVK